FVDEDDDRDGTGFPVGQILVHELQVVIPQQHADFHMALLRQMQKHRCVHHRIAAPVFCNHDGAQVFILKPSEEIPIIGYRKIAEDVLQVFLMLFHAADVGLSTHRLVKPIIQFCHRNPSNCIFFHQFNLIISGTSYGRFCFGRISYCVFQIYTLTLSKHIKGGVRLHENSRHIQGLLFVIIGAALWGIGGTAADYIFRHTPVTVDWYVTFRLTASGIILLFAYALFSRKQQPVRMDRKTLGMLFVYSLLGMTMVQYSFMAAIGHGNAAIATVLQYTGPIYIILWLVI